MDSRNKIIDIDGEKFIYFGDYMTLYKLGDTCSQQLTMPNFRMSTLTKIFQKSNDEMEPIHLASDNPGIDTLCLILTRNCTLRCKYCYAIDTNPSDIEQMTLETAIRAIETMVERNITTDTFYLIFFGGEPMLKFDLIKQIVEYCERNLMEKRNKKIVFSIITNGTLINSLSAKFFKNKNIYVQISMDGDKYHHDKNRIFASGRGSFDVVMKTLEILSTNNVNFNIHSTLSPDTNLFQTISFFESLQIPFGYSFSLEAPGVSKTITNYTTKHLKSLMVEFKNLNEFYYDKFKNHKIVFCQNVMDDIAKIKNRLAKKVACLAGRTVVSILPDGTIISCQNLQKISMFHQGNVMNNCNSKFVSAYSVDSIAKCRNCWIKHLCGGGCFYEKYISNGNIVEPVEAKCIINRLKYQYIIGLYVLLEKDNLIPQLEKSIIHTKYQIYV